MPHREKQPDSTQPKDPGCYRRPAIAGVHQLHEPWDSGFPLSAGMMSKLLVFSDFIFRVNTHARSGKSRISA